MKKSAFIFYLILSIMLTFISCSNRIISNQTLDFTPSSQPTIEAIKHNQIVSDEKNDSVNALPMQQEKNFSDEIVDIFKLVKKYYPEFVYSTVYVDTSESNKKMVFPKKDDLYSDEFVSYQVIYHTEGFINYFYDAGTSYRGYGSYFVIDEDTVIKIEKSLGVSTYSYEIYTNGKIIDGESKEHNFYFNNSSGSD